MKFCHYHIVKLFLFFSLFAISAVKYFLCYTVGADEKTFIRQLDFLDKLFDKNELIRPEVAYQKFSKKS